MRECRSPDLKPSGFKIVVKPWNSIVKMGHWLARYLTHSTKIKVVF